MKLSKSIAFLSLLFIAFCCTYTNAQKKVSIRQDSKFEKLLNEKRKYNLANGMHDRYKVQLLSGTGDKAKATLDRFKTEFPDIECLLVYQTPNYKVWAGGFRTRMEAERNFSDIKLLYPTAYLIKPEK